MICLFTFEFFTHKSWLWPWYVWCRFCQDLQMVKPTSSVPFSFSESVHRRLFAFSASQSLGIVMFDKENNMETHLSTGGIPYRHKKVKQKRLLLSWVLLSRTILSPRRGGIFIQRVAGNIRKSKSVMPWSASGQKLTKDLGSKDYCHEGFLTRTSEILRVQKSCMLTLDIFLSTILSWIGCELGHLDVGFRRGWFNLIFHGI